MDPLLGTTSVGIGTVGPRLLEVLVRMYSIMNPKIALPAFQLVFLDFPRLKNGEKTARTSDRDIYTCNSTVVVAHVPNHTHIPDSTDDTYLLEFYKIRFTS